MTRVAVVTGANRGIGFAIAERLALNDVHTILACRSDIKCQKALQALRQKGITNVEFRPCDLSDNKSIDLLIASLDKQVDILINNANIAFKSNDPTPFTKQAGPTLQVNYFGTLYLTERMLPILEKSSFTPVIVNIASSAGYLKILKRAPELLSRFASSSLSIDELSSLCNEFVNAVETDTYKESLWPESCYGISKLAIIALTKILAAKNPNMIINACCPGFCATELTSNQGNKSVSEGAVQPVKLALLQPTIRDDGSIHFPHSGRFFAEGNEVEW